MLVSITEHVPINLCFKYYQGGFIIIHLEYYILFLYYKVKEKVNDKMSPKRYTYYCCSMPPRQYGVQNIFSQYTYYYYYVPDFQCFDFRQSKNNENVPNDSKMSLNSV